MENRRNQNQPTTIPRWYYSHKQNNKHTKTVNVIETFQHLKRLEFHESKTKKSIFNGKKEDKIEINGSEIKRATEHTYLGKVIEEGIFKSE